MPEQPQKRLKLAFVVDRFGNRFGGAEAYGVELMRQLSRDHDITVFAREYDPACGIDLPFVALASWQHWPSWVRVLLFAIRARRATRTGFDIVHSHMNGWCGDIEVIHVTPVRYNWRVRAMPWLKKTLSFISPRVQTYLGLEARRVQPRPGHRTVAVSQLIATQLQQAYGAKNSYPVIPPGVVPPTSVPETEIEAARTALGLAATDFICLMVARNPMRKGLPTVLAALAQLPPFVKLVVVGSNADTRDFIFGKPGYPDLSDRVKLVPPTPSVAMYYHMADLYVHPTLNDSFGMAPLEAMSYGLPVIISPPPWCGFAQYVTHDHDALVLDHPENAEQLSSWIHQLSTDHAVRKRLQEGAIQVVQRHGWDTVASSYLTLYNDVMVEKRSQ